MNRLYCSLVVTTHDLSLETVHPPRRSWWDAYCHADLVLPDLTARIDSRSGWIAWRLGSRVVLTDWSLWAPHRGPPGCSVLAETKHSRGATMRSAACDHA